jgi:hypothetical protein
MDIRTAAQVLPLAVLLAACQPDPDAPDDGASGETSDGETGDTGDGDTGDGDGDGDQLEPIPILGNGTHDIDTLDVTIISSPGDGLAFPTDLEFKPGVERELWVTNRADYSIVVYQNAGRSDQLSMKFQASGDDGQHFLAKPAALAFGENGLFATAQQEDQVTQPGDPPDGSFMGPTLWTSDLSVFNGGFASHEDMLHNSPLSSGIAWESGNSYWVFDGAHGSLTYYRFNSDHGIGGTDHSDGQIYRYVDGELGYEPSIPSHVAWDPSAAKVYAADTANGRIVRVDPGPATMGGALGPNYDGGSMNYMVGAELVTLVDGTTLEPIMSKPSGLELVDGILFVTDPIEARVYGFDLDGNLLDWLDTGLPPGSLLGMAFDEEGSLYIVDAVANQLRKFSLK